MRKVLLHIFFWALFGCSKSDEKLIAGVWDVQQLLINDIDSTAAVKSQTCYTRMKFLTEKESADRVANILNVDPQDSGCNLRGAYELKDNVLRLDVGTENFIPVGAFWYRIHNDKIAWNIITLNKEKLELETDFNGDKNRLNLIRQ
jgi:hypothetical protein